MKRTVVQRSKYAQKSHFPGLFYLMAIKNIRLLFVGVILVGTAQGGTAMAQNSNNGEKTVIKVVDLQQNNNHQGNDDDQGKNPQGNSQGNGNGNGGGNGQGDNGNSGNGGGNGQGGNGNGGNGDSNGQGGNGNGNGNGGGNGNGNGQGGNGNGGNGNDQGGNGGDKTVSGDDKTGSGGNQGGDGNGQNGNNNGNGQTSHQTGGLYGHTYNQRAVESTVRTLWGDKWAADRGLTEPDEIRYALDQMGGSIYGTLANSSITNTSLVNSTLGDVLRRGEFGGACTSGFMAACDPCVGTACDPSVGSACDPYGMTSYSYSYARKPLQRNLWGLAFGTGGATHYDDNAYGYHQSYFGTIVGLDRLYGRTTRAGLYVSYGEGWISSDLLDHSKSRELQFGLYLRKELRIGYMFLNGGLGYNQYHTERELSYLGLKTSSKHEAFVGTLYGERGIEFQGALARWQPFLGLQYIGNQQSRFTESGAGMYSLEGDITTGSSLRMLFGTRLSRDIARINHGMLSLSGKAVWMHEFLDAASTSFNGRFVGTDKGITVRGNNAGRDWAVLGGGLTYDRRNWRMFAGYDISFNTRQVLHTANAGLAYGW